MRAVWKFPIPLSGAALVAMPAGAEIIDVQMQIDCSGLRRPGKEICAWAIVDPEAQLMIRSLGVVGTGQELMDGDTAKTHIATIQDGPFVWHIFDGGWQ